MTQDDEAKAMQRARETQEAPQVYAVQKGLASWRFDRRGFLAAAGAALVGTAAGCCPATPEPTATPADTPTPTNTPTPTHIPTPTSTPTPTNTPWPTLSPEEAEEQAVRLETCRGIRAHDGYIQALAISPDGTLLLSASDETIKLWLLPEGALVKTLEGHTGPVNFLVVSSDGTLLASGSDDRSIRLWSLPGGELTSVLEPHASGVWCLAMTPDGTLLAAGGISAGMNLWSLPGRELVTTIGDQWDTHAMAVSPDGALLASGSYDGSIRLWSLPEGELLETLEDHVDVILYLAISSDGTLLVSGDQTGDTKLWSLPEGELLKTLRVDNHNRFAMAPDGSLLASGGGWGKTIKLWSLPEGELVRVLEGHTEDISVLAVNSEATFLVSGDEEGALRLWSLAEGTFSSCLMDLAANESHIEGVTYRLEGESGELLEYTLPCGSPIPPGAVCVCNCVAGGYVPPCSCVGYTSGHYWYPC